jgi:hypothetical protein
MAIMATITGAIAITMLSERPRARRRSSSKARPSTGGYRSTARRFGYWLYVSLTEFRRDLGTFSTSANRDSQIAAIGASVIVLFLIGLSTPIFFSEAIIVDARAQAQDWREDKTPTQADQLAAISDPLDGADQLAFASTLSRDGSLYDDAAVLTTWAAYRQPDVQLAHDLIARADALTRGALIRDPLQPAIWLRLSYLRQKAGDDDRAAQALKLSLISGTVAPNIHLARVRLGLDLLPILDTDTSEMLRRQIRMMDVLAPSGSVELLAQSTPSQRLFIDNALADSRSYR